MKLPRLELQPELDALRGLFLVWMTLTHPSTRFSDFVNLPIGFVSSAEGFVFVSALFVLAANEVRRKRAERRLQGERRGGNRYSYNGDGPSCQYG